MNAGTRYDPEWPDVAAAEIRVHARRIATYFTRAREAAMSTDRFYDEEPDRTDYEADEDAREAAREQREDEARDEAAAEPAYLLGFDGRVLDDETLGAIVSEFLASIATQPMTLLPAARHTSPAHARPRPSRRRVVIERLAIAAFSVLALYAVWLEFVAVVHALSV